MSNQTFALTLSLKSGVKACSKKKIKKFYYMVSMSSTIKNQHFRAFFFIFQVEFYWSKKNNNKFSLVNVTIIKKK
ncbi:hypothetical protein BpHYR1_028478 [Brachionus plicatilis]|uniref:Uncharacterized protein n=1 Tax=Brachionus plicatilis TaxID=10195 RepID=A0A3M7S0L6_BRAPC|nr:hypothetical protein BpHYR1_028478 [Brachionus plicatilis]